MDKPKKSPPNKNQCCGLHLGCYEFVEMQKKIKDLETKLAEIKNQTAIAELEKLKKEMFEGKCQMWLDIATNEYVINHRDKSIIDYIDKRINELRGGK